jgi:putative toxin-antitoxin system antitoxin component (TIGR02293 family)
METLAIKKGEKDTLASKFNQLDLSLHEAFVRNAPDNEYFRDYSKSLTFSDFFSDRMLIVLAIKEGIPFHLFSLIKEISPFSNDEWSDLLNLSTKSLSRYRTANKRFKPIQSEKIIELAEVTKTGLEVFDSPGQFKLWLETPNFALGKRKPMDLLYDSYGKELVLGALTRIDQGIFA